MTREQQGNQDRMVLLQEEELTEELKKLPGWEKTRDKLIACEYKFKNYLDGINFAKEIGEYAEKRQHHPSIQIDYKKVIIETTSWDVGGVSTLDIDVAKDFNDIHSAYI